jgi:tetratricopeptide (TPR) repeat protein
MPNIFSLFNLFTLIYIFRGAQIVLEIWRQWTPLRQEPLQRWKKHLANQASFFVAVPPGVAIHELCHALAIWLFGGQIAEFGYRVFWGYVAPVGGFAGFTAAQNWFIALAGTLGNLAYGAGLWLLLRHNSASSLRFFGLRSFRFQLHFALIYYPVFTLFVQQGSDWRVIYDFASTPLLSFLTLVAHLLALGLFVLADRQGWFEMAGFETVVEQEAFAVLAQQAAIRPEDTAVYLQYIDGLRRGGAEHKARTRLQGYLAQHPQSAEGYLQLAVLLNQNKEYVPPKSKEAAERALQLGLTRPFAVALTHQMLGRYELDHTRVAAALNHFNQAIELLPNPEYKSDFSPLFTAQLYSQRSLAYRQQKQYDLALSDAQQALQLAQAAGSETAVAQFEQELAVLEHHAGIKRPL